MSSSESEPTAVAQAPDRPTMTYADAGVDIQRADRTQPAQRQKADCGEEASFRGTSVFAVGPNALGRFGRIGMGFGHEK